MDPLKFGTDTVTQNQVTPYAPGRAPNSAYTVTPAAPTLYPRGTSDPAPAAATPVSYPNQNGPGGSSDPNWKPQLYSDAGMVNKNLPAGTPGGPPAPGSAGANVPGEPAAPKSAADYTAAAESSPGVQSQLDAIRASFSDQLNEQTKTAEERKAQTNYSSVARGLIGSPDAVVAEGKTDTANKNERKAIYDQQSAAIEQVLRGADSLAMEQAQLDQTKYQTDYTNWQAKINDLRARAQEQFTTLASTASGSWADFAKAAPDSAQKMIDQTGYDPAVIPFLWNNTKTKAQQIQYDANPVSMPDGTLMFIGHDPTKSGPDSIVRTPIDTAPQGFQTTVVGGLPYWKSTDGSGAMYPVPSDKGQFITLKDSSGNNYLYNTYTKQYLNPLGADTSGSGNNTSIVSPNAPASPLSESSTLANLLGYYVQGNTSYTPGSGYTGAVLQAMDGVSLDTPLSQLKDKLPQLMAGIIKAEGSPALVKVNNGGAILWSTAQAYGMDTQFGATPIQMMGSNGKMMTYASFPDAQSGSVALQSYLTSIMSKNSAGQDGQLDPAIAQSGLGTTADKWQAQGILTGQSPPFNPTTGSISKSKGNVMAILAKAGFNLTKAWQQYQATTKFIASANSPQQLRMKQAENSVERSLPALQSKVDKLNADGAMSGFKFVNRASIEAAANGTFGKEAAVDAQAVIGQLALITDELGQTFMGGNSPTDSAFDLAKGVLASNFTYDQFVSQIGLIKENLGYRKVSWQSVGAVDASGQPIDNGGGQSVQQQAEAAGYDYQAMKAAGHSDAEISQALNGAH